MKNNRKLLTLIALLTVFNVGYSEENVWLKKLNRQKETVKEAKIIQLNPGLPNLVGIIYLQKKFQKEEKETFAGKNEIPQRKSAITISSYTPQPGIKIKQNQQNQITTPTEGNRPSRSRQNRIRLMGYCFFDRDIEIFGFEKMYATLPCSFEGIEGTAQVMGELIPKPRSYSLEFKPLEVYIGHRIYKVVSGYALSGDRSSVNIASEIDTQAIKKILASAGVDAGEQTAEMIKQGARDAQTTVTVNGDVVVKKSEFDINLIGKSALWTGIASLVKNTADYFKRETQNIPITYKIYKGSRLWLNIDVKPLQPLP